MTVDVSGIVYFGPIFAFLLVWVVLFAVLNKTKLLGDGKFVQIFVSFLIATIFIALGGVKEYVLTIAPWFAVLLISLFFILAMLGLAGKVSAGLTKGLGVTFLILLVLVFLISGIVVFSNVLAPYLPGSSVAGGSEDILQFTDWLYSDRVVGAIVLVIASAFVSWILVKSGS